MVARGGCNGGAALDQCLNQGGEVDARRSELEQIAKVRNNIMHFNNDPLPEGVSSMSSAPRLAEAHTPAVRCGELASRGGRERSARMVVMYSLQRRNADRR
jgi:hypothetical protein